MGHDGPAGGDPETGRGIGDHPQRIGASEARPHDVRNGLTQGLVTVVCDRLGGPMKVVRQVDGDAHAFIMGRPLGGCCQILDVPWNARDGVFSADQTLTVAPFVSGIDLNAAFYDEVVAPILGSTPHSAGLLGWGSDVLGFDTARSTDHGWGPRLRVFVEPSEVAAAQAALDAALPAGFRGWPVSYGWDSVTVEHRVRVSDRGSWLVAQLGHDPRAGMGAIDWLVMPQQLLLGVVRGAVFHDGLGELGPVRDQLAWYPDDVWRWLVACQWQRVAQEEAFVGRAAEVGDELGSQLVATRQVHELMRLWFLLHREYWPYTKWFGSAFARLPGAPDLLNRFDVVMRAADWPERQRALVDAYEVVARGHNEAGITEWVDPTVRPFFGRGFLVLMSDRFVDACRASVTDPTLASLPLIGSVDQVVDSTDVLSVAARARHLRALYEAQPVDDVFHHLGVRVVG